MQPEKGGLATPAVVVTRDHKMVLQIPRLTSSEILENDETPMDLSVSNRTRCPAPSKSPDYYRDTMSPDYPDHSYDDYRSYHDRDYNGRDTMSPHDSDDSDSQRGVPHNPAKSYKKAIMKRYFDTESSHVVSHHHDSHNNNSHHDNSNSQQHQQQQREQHQPRHELMVPDQLLRQHHSNDSPTHTYMYKANGTYTSHPAAHIGHRTAYSTSHPNTLVDTESSHVVLHHHDSHNHSSNHHSIHNHSSHHHNIHHHSSHHHNSSFRHQHQQRDLLLQEFIAPGQLLHQHHSNNSPTRTSMYNTKGTYAIHPAAHVGHRTAYSTSHPNTSVGGSLPPSPADSGVVVDVVESFSGGHNSNDETKHWSILAPVAGFKRSYSNTADNNWKGQCVEYADLDLYYLRTDTNPTTDGFSLDHIDSQTLEIDGNLPNNNNENLFTSFPQDLTLDIPNESFENNDVRNSGLESENGVLFDPLIRDNENTCDIQTNTKYDFEIALSDCCFASILRKVPGVGGRARWPKSWEFVMRLIVHEETNPYLVRWENESQHIFRLVQSDKITHIWNTKSEKASHSYYNFARGLRYHYKKQILIPIREKQLVYQCGPKAIEYINELQQS